MVIVDTRVLVAWLIIDSDESGDEVADLTINLSSRSAVVLGQPLPSVESLSSEQVFEWHKWFSGGTANVEDDESVGFPTLAITEQNTATIHDMRGPPLTSVVSVNKHYYIEVLKRLLSRKSRKKISELGREGYMLHQGNAFAHRAPICKNVSDQQKLTVMRHPPYSPDLAP
ncbi:hypothetical protein TNCV_391581 [Trichonephila clavipes]|nr:hypothetical protein TNCV_391581 [Trichonephila clavipes]